MSRLRRELSVLILIPRALCRVHHQCGRHAPSQGGQQVLDGIGVAVLSPGGDRCLARRPRGYARVGGAHESRYVPRQMLLFTVSGRVNRLQQDMIAYLIEENRVY